LSVAKCPNCSKQARIPVDFKGGKVKCKSCGAVFECPPGEPSAPQDPLIGKTLGDYKIVRKLGEGGMGAVYEAWQQKLDRSVALKVLSRGLADDEKYIVRFRREARSAARLTHHNIVQIYDVGEQEGIHFFSMEFVQGETLLDRLKKKKVLDPEEAGEYVLQAARGLEYAHRMNIIHRDIKPENLMINTEGIVKIADLGLAKKLSGEEQAMTMAGVAMGTPYYIAPEQASDAASADHRADIYSLGCTFYQFLTGRLPFDGQSSFEIMTKHTSEPVVPPKSINADIPDAFSALIMKMMEKDPRRRPQSLKEVISEIEDFLGVQRSGRLNVPKSDAEPFARILQMYTEAARAYPANLLTALAAGAIALSLISLLVDPLFGLCALIGSVLGIGAHLWLAGAMLNGYGYRRLAKKMRGFRFVDWVSVGAGALVVLVFLLMLGVKSFLTAAVVGGVAVAVYYVLSRPKILKLKEYLGEIGELFQRWKDAGIPDENIAKFFYDHSGLMWETICEHFQGRGEIRKLYDETTEIRKGTRTFYEKMRAFFFDRIDAEAEHRREAEAKAAATAPPESPQGADQTAPGVAQMAETAIRPGAAAATIQRPQTTPTAIIGGQNAASPEAAQAESMQTVIPQVTPERERKSKGPVAMLLGGQSRFIVGAMLLAIFVIARQGKFDLLKAAWMKHYCCATIAAALIFSAIMRNAVSLLLLIAAAVLAVLALPGLEYVGQWGGYGAIGLAAVGFFYAIGRFAGKKKA